MSRGEGLGCILGIGPHPDDVELCCGGTLLRAREIGYRTAVVDLTQGELGSNGSAEERAKESEVAAAILGVDVRLNCQLPDGHIDRNSTLQRKALVEAIRSIRPDLVLLPHGIDDHPDHVEACHLGEYAIYLSGLSRYPAGGEAHRTPWVAFYPARSTFDPQYVVEISSVMEKKMEAVRAHRSQFSRRGMPDVRETPINSPDFFGRIEKRARRFGRAAGVTLGEGFISRRPLDLGGELGSLFIATEDSGSTPKQTVWLD